MHCTSTKTCTRRKRRMSKRPDKYPPKVVSTVSEIDNSFATRNEPCVKCNNNAFNVIITNCYLKRNALTKSNAHVEHVLDRVVMRVARVCKQSTEKMCYIKSRLACLPICQPARLLFSKFSSM